MKTENMISTYMLTFFVVTGALVVWLPLSLASIHQAIGHLSFRSRDLSKLRGFGLEFTIALSFAWGFGHLFRCTDSNIQNGLRHLTTYRVSKIRILMVSSFWDVTCVTHQQIHSLWCYWGRRSVILVCISLTCRPSRVGTRYNNQQYIPYIINRTRIQWPRSIVFFSANDIGYFPAA